jgi:hypothetical protein
LAPGPRHLAGTPQDAEASISPIDLTRPLFYPRGMVSPASFALIAPDTLVVDLEAGERHAITQVEYRREPDWVILHRLDGNDWLKVAIPYTGPNDPALVHGSFTTLQIRPGQCYQACIVPADFRPTASQQPYDWIVSYGDSEGPPAFVSIVALRKAPEARDFYADGNSRTYGTFHERDVVTEIPVLAQFSVGREPPRDLGNGRLTLVSPTAVQVRAKGQTFGFQVSKLVPGTEYHTLLLLVDEFGNWQFIAERITTLRRRVEVTLQALFIVDDADDFSNGEGDFQFKVLGGGVAESNKVLYANSNLESGKFVAPSPNETMTLGPYTPLPDRLWVHFRVDGAQDNTGAPLDLSDDAASGVVEIPCPSGPGETVTNLPGAIQVRDQIREDFEFRVDYRYSVTYL